MENIDKLKTQNDDIQSQISIIKSKSNLTVEDQQQLLILNKQASDISNKLYPLLNSIGNSNITNIVISAKNNIEKNSNDNLISSTVNSIQNNISAQIDSAKINSELVLGAIEKSVAHEITQVENVITNIGSIGEKYLKYLSIPPIPTIPSIPSIGSLMSMVKFPKISEYVHTSINNAKKLGRIKKQNGSIDFSPTAAIKDISKSINTLKDKNPQLFKNVPQLDSLINNVGSVSEQIDMTKIGIENLQKNLDANTEQLNYEKKLVEINKIDKDMKDKIKSYKDSKSKE